MKLVHLPLFRPFSKSTVSILLYLYLPHFMLPRAHFKSDTALIYRAYQALAGTLVLVEVPKVSNKCSDHDFDILDKTKQKVSAKASSSLVLYFTKVP